MSKKEGEGTFHALARFFDGLGWKGSGSAHLKSTDSEQIFWGQGTFLGKKSQKRRRLLCKKE